MTGKLLQAIGVLALLAAMGGTVAGLLLLEDRVRIVVMAGGSDQQPDSDALLRDDLRQLDESMQRLTQAIGENFGRLQQAGEAAAATRHRELIAALGDLEHRRAQAAAAEEIKTADPEPPEKSAGGFLTFTMPAATPRFDQLQQYVLLPELSRVGFDAKSTLHDFTGVTSQLSGAFTADFDDPQGQWTGQVTCNAATLRTGVEGRDADLRQHLDTEHHPDIRFDLHRFVPQPDGIDAGRQTARGEVVGTMTIRGKSRELRMAVRVSVDAGKRVLIEGDAPLKLTDFGVPVPSQLGLIRMQDEVKVWVSLRARARVGK